MSSRIVQMLVATAMLCLPTISAAQTLNQKEAIVISAFEELSAPATRGLREDALAVSEALFGLGYNVRRLENPATGVVDSAIEAAKASSLVVYYASADGMDVDLNARFAASADQQTFVFLDLCRGEAAPIDRGSDPVIAWAEPRAIPADTFIAASIAPGVSCGADTASVSDRLIEGLEVPGLALDLAFAEDEPDAVPIWNRTTLRDTFVFRKPSSYMRLTSDHYALLDTLSPTKQAQMIALWEQAGIAVDRDASALGAQIDVQETVVISSPVRPVRTAAAVIAPRVSPGVTQIQDGVSLTAADPARSVENRAVPGVGGLPTPSIIVGLIATNAAFGTVTEDGGALSGSELDYSNLVARRAMRDEDPALFASLVETGAFDPPASELVIALQTELARMECYTAGIDGSWGRGSSRALSRYYEEINETAPNLEATNVAFRQIVLRDSVVCPPIAVAAPAAPRRNTTASTAPSRNNTSTAPRRAAPAPAAPAPAQPAPSRTINRSTATGVFR